MSSFVPSRQGQTQVALRLPTTALAQRFRDLLAKDELEGVELLPEPAKEETSALNFVTQHFTFKMDGETYPARLANLPTLVETHKTLDRATYYKTGDVSQIVVAYTTEAAREACELRSAGPATGEKQTHRKRACLADGLAPPLRDVVERRFAKAAKRAYGPSYTATEINDAEKEMVELYANANTKTSAVPPAYSKEEVFEEIVPLEDWMIDQQTGGAIKEQTDDSMQVQRHPWILMESPTNQLAQQSRLTPPYSSPHAQPAAGPPTARSTSPAAMAPVAAPPANETLSERRTRVANELSLVHSETEALEMEAKSPEATVRARAIAALTAIKDKRKKLTLMLNKTDENLLFEAAKES